MIDMSAVEPIQTLNSKIASPITLVGFIFVVSSVSALLLSNTSLTVLLTFTNIYLFLALKFSRHRVIALSKYWTKLIALVAKISNPLLLGFVFYLIVFPIGLVLRLSKYDRLRLRSSKRMLSNFQTPPKRVSCNFESLS